MKELMLSKGKVALVDDADYEVVVQHKWYAIRPSGKTWYAARSTWNPRTCIYLHRAIMGASALHVDHIDGNGLNNQRSNLRLATRSENLRNRAGTRNGYKGVFLHKASGLWTARVKPEPKCVISLGYFKTEIEAAKAYDSAARKYYGQFARPNFGESGPIETASKQQPEEV